MQEQDLVLNMDVSFDERIETVASMLHTMESVGHGPDLKDTCLPVASKNRSTAQESGYCARRLQPTIDPNYYSFRGNVSLGTITNGDVLDVRVSHSLTHEALPTSIGFDGQLLTTEQYLLTSFQPFRMWFRPWATGDHVCGENSLDEESHRGLIAQFQNVGNTADISLINHPSVELCDARHWIIVLFHNFEDGGRPNAFYMHLSFAMRQVQIGLRRALQYI